MALWFFKKSQGIVMSALVSSIVGADVLCGSSTCCCFIKLFRVADLVYQLANSAIINIYGLWIYRWFHGFRNDSWLCYFCKDNLESAFIRPKKKIAFQSYNVRMKCYFLCSCLSNYSQTNPGINKLNLLNSCAILLV